MISKNIDCGRFDAVSMQTYIDIPANPDMPQIALKQRFVYETMKLEGC